MVSPDVKRYFELSYAPNAREITAVTLPRDQRQVRGLNLRRSQRWCNMVFPGVGGPYELPHIDRLGRFTGASVYTLACNPADLVSITASTVFGRLKRYASAHNGSKEANRHLREILRAAVYYTLSKNSYFMDRILCFLRDLKKHGKLIHKVTLKYLAKCDADKRFVYGQACYNANWLIFRACRPRDKSHNFNDRLDPSFLRDGGHSREKQLFKSHVTAICEKVACMG